MPDNIVLNDDEEQALDEVWRKIEQEGFSSGQKGYAPIDHLAAAVELAEESPRDENGFLTEEGRAAVLAAYGMVDQSAEPQSKTLSSLNPLQGGALVPGPAQGRRVKRVRVPRLKYLVKEQGQPCKQGEAASRTGCVPAEGESHAQPQKETPKEATKPQATRKPKTVREKVLRELIAAGKRIAAKLPAQAKAVAEKAAAKLPASVKTPALNVFHIAEGAMMAGNFAARALALETARKLGANEEQTEKLSRVMGAVDLWAQVTIGNTLLVQGLVIPAKIASVTPFASAGYLLYATARHPVKAPAAILQSAFELLRNRFPRTMKGAASFFWSSLRHPLTPHGHGEEHHGKAFMKGLEDERQAKLCSLLCKRLMEYGDEWYALFSAALDEVHDPLKASGMAMTILQRDGEKSLRYHVKERGQPCKQGETAERSGCIPASGDSGKKPPSKKPTTRQNPDAGKTDPFAKAPAKRGAMMQAVRDGTGKDAKIVLRNGQPAPDHIKPSMVAPDWTNVEISLDPDAELLVKAVDNKGRIKSVYSDAHDLRTAAIKFARIDEMMRQSRIIDSEIQEARDNPKTREQADCAWLMAVQATRPGSKADTGAKVKAYGATTLEGRHVLVDERGEVSLKFIGKEGVSHNHKIRNPRLAAMLKERKEAAGDSGKLFNTSEGAVNSFIGKLDGHFFSSKDFRTRKANLIAVRAISRFKGLPKNEKEYKARVKAVAYQVSTVLGNKPEQCLESYINPVVFSIWRGIFAAES